MVVAADRFGLVVELAGAAGLELPPFDAGNGVVHQPRILLGRILSGDQFTNCADRRLRLHGGFLGRAVEMEGGALAQVAERFGAPCVVVRYSATSPAPRAYRLHRLPALDGERRPVVVRRLIPVLSKVLKRRYGERFTKSICSRRM
jgi:hypothetical protein